MDTNHNRNKHTKGGSNTRKRSAVNTREQRRDYDYGYEEEQQTPRRQNTAKRKLSKKQLAKKRRRKIVLFVAEVVVLLLLIIVYWGMSKVSDIQYV